MCVPDPPNHRATFPQVQGLSAAGRATRLVCVALRHSARRTILKTSLQHAARRNAARLLVLAYHTPPPPQPQFPFRPCVCVCLSNDSRIVCFWLGYLFDFCWYISLGHCGVLVGRLIRMARGCYVSPIWLIHINKSHVYVWMECEHMCSPRVTARFNEERINNLACRTCVSYIYASI